MIPVSKPIIGREEEQAVLDVLRSGMIIQGPRVKELEEKFAKLCSTKYAVAVNNGTAALHTALHSLGIGQGDEVITVPFTFVATANSIAMCGAKPVFVDVKEDTFNINPELIEEKITSKTKAIVPVDLFGQAYDFKAVREIAEKHGLKILEDAAQAVGATIDGKKAGTLGNAATFSFYATKNIMSGEGGIITTDDAGLVEKAKRFRHHGQEEGKHYEYLELGHNYRLTDLQAALVLVQLEKLEDFTKRRIENAKILSEGLKGLEGITIPFEKPNAKHVFHQYSIKVEGFKMERDALVAYLEKKGIGSAVFYPKPLHLHSFYTKMGYKEGDFPVSEKLSKIVLSLPVNPTVTKEDANKIVEVF